MRFNTRNSITFPRQHLGLCLATLNIPPSTDTENLLLSAGLSREFHTHSKRLIYKCSSASSTLRQQYSLTACSQRTSTSYTVTVLIPVDLWYCEFHAIRRTTFVLFPVASTTTHTNVTHIYIVVQRESEALASTHSTSYLFSQLFSSSAEAIAHNGYTPTNSPF